MIRIAIVIISASALIAAATWYLRAVEAEFAQQLLHSSEQAETIHEFNQFTLITTDENGAIKSQLQAPYTRYSVTQQKTHLNSPAMVVYRKQKSPVKISSDTAIVDHRSNITTLNSNVDVAIKNNNGKPLRMITQLLQVDNSSQVATTTEAARIYYGKSRMDGTGLELDLQNEKVKLLDNVQGLYEQ